MNRNLVEVKNQKKKTHACHFSFLGSRPLIVMHSGSSPGKLHRHMFAHFHGEELLEAEQNEGVGTSFKTELTRVRKVDLGTIRQGTAH